jgi:hypothetical protein
VCIFVAAATFSLPSRYLATTGAFYWFVAQCQSYITTDSQLANSSWCQAPIWDPRPIFLSPWNFFRQLQVCYFVAPSLTRGWVCNLLLLPALASAVPLGSESRGAQDHILLSQFLSSPNLVGQVPVFISPPDQGTGFPFRLLLWRAGLLWRH